MTFFFGIMLYIFKMLFNEEMLLIQVCRVLQGTSLLVIYQVKSFWHHLPVLPTNNVKFFTAEDLLQ